MKFRYEPGDEVGIGGGTRTVHAVVVQDNGATVTVNNAIDDMAPPGGQVFTVDRSRVHPSAQDAVPYAGTRTQSIGFRSVEEWCEALGNESGSPQCKRPDEGPGIGMAVAVGLGAVGLVGLGMYLLNRKGAAEPKLGATEYTIGLEGSAFDPKAQAFRNALEQRGFEITGFGTASRFNGDVIGGDIDVLDPQGTHFDQEEAVARSRKFFKMGDLHGVNVRYVSAGPTGEEKEELGRVGVREFLRQRPKPCIPCGEDSGWEVVKSNGDVSLPYHNKGDAESDAKLNGGSVRPLAKFSDSKKLRKVYGS